MNYQQIKGDGTGISYRVTDHGTQAAEFFYHMQDSSNIAGDGERKFWLDGVKLFGDYVNYECMYAVLRFVSYKCWCAKGDAIHLKINGKNLFYLELYKKFGFYVIAEEIREIHKNIKNYEYVMKYSLPQTREEEYSNYIRGK